MKLTTKTGLSFISLSAIFFLLGSVFMYFAVRVILADDLSSRLYQMQKDFIENLNNDLDINNLSNKNTFISESFDLIEPIIADTVLIENGKYVLYRKIKFAQEFKNKNYSIEILQSQTQTDLLIWRIVLLNVLLAMTFFFNHFLSKPIKC